MESFSNFTIIHNRTRSVSYTHLYLVEDPTNKPVAFELRAPLDVWHKVMDKKIDPIRGIMSGQLKLKGNMMTVLKSPKAATELVGCAMKVDTEWPQ